MNKLLESINERDFDKIIVGKNERSIKITDSRYIVNWSINHTSLSITYDKDMYIRELSYDPIMIDRFKLYFPINNTRYSETRFKFYIYNQDTQYNIQNICINTFKYSYFINKDNKIDFVMGLKVRDDLDMFTAKRFISMYYNILKDFSINKATFKIYSPYLEFVVDKDFYMFVNADENKEFKKQFYDIIERKLTFMNIPIKIKENMNKLVVRDYIESSEKINILPFHEPNEENQQLLKEEIVRKIINKTKTIDNFEKAEYSYY